MEGFPLLNSNNGMYVGAEICSDLHHITHRIDTTIPLMTVMPLVQWDIGTRLSSLFLALASSWMVFVTKLVSCWGARWNRLMWVDFVVVPYKLRVLKTSIWDACRVVLAKMMHWHVRVEKV